MVEPLFAKEVAKMNRQKTGRDHEVSPIHPSQYLFIPFGALAKIIEFALNHLNVTLPILAIAFAYGSGFSVDFRQNPNPIVLTTLSGPQTSKMIESLKVPGLHDQVCATQFSIVAPFCGGLFK